MRKASIFATACLALAAMVALSAPVVTAAKKAPAKKALANKAPGKQPNSVITYERHEPACNAYGNAFGVFEFGVSTPDNNQQHMVSSVTGNGIACGPSITCQFDTNQGRCVNTDYAGQETLNDHATITTPPGAVVTPAASLTDGAYAGRADINILSYLAADNKLPVFVPNEIATLTVDKGAGTDCPSNAVVCYKGATTVGIAGHGWQWVTEDQVIGRNILTIGPFYNDSTFTPAGLTKINTFSLCANQGDVGGNACGDSRHMYIQANGDASAPDCNGGAGPEGVYSVTATNKAGATTASATACVPWVSIIDRFPKDIEELG